MRIKFLKTQKFPGFTLIELMIVVSIISLLSAITLSSNVNTNRGRQAILADSTSIVVNLRDMQNRTTSFVENVQVQNIGYGVFFNLASPNKLETFYKTIGGYFDASEILSGNKPSMDSVFNQGDYLSSICIESCSVKTTQKLAVYFLRPKPYIHFSYLDGSSYTDKVRIAGVDKRIDHVCLELAPQNLKTNYQKVDISYVGQISFSTGKCE